jgi:HD-like signal output (HDOD) protein
MEKLWEHSLASAYSARSIGAAKKMSLNDTEKLFFMGLIHDIGKLPLIKELADIFSKSGSSMHINMADVTARIQDFHYSFGEAVLQQWRFTEDFVRVVKLHGGPKFFETTNKEILIVNLANMLTRKIGYSLFEDAELKVSEIDSAIFLDMDAKKLQAVQEEVNETMQTLANVY